MGLNIRWFSHGVLSRSIRRHTFMTAPPLSELPSLGRPFFWAAYFFPRDPMILIANVVSLR
jgi:hypothetical protein